MSLSLLLFNYLVVLDVLDKAIKKEKGIEIICFKKKR